MLLALLAVGCATPDLVQDRHYPQGWPDTVGVGEGCRAIEGSFENQGVLVDGSGVAKDIWLTDVIASDEPFRVVGLPMSKVKEAYAQVEEVRKTLRSCVRVELSLEPVTQRASRLIIKPSRPVDPDHVDRFEPCRSLEVPQRNIPPRGGVQVQWGGPDYGAGGLCAPKALFFGRHVGTPSEGYLYLGLAGDGALVVKRPKGWLVGPDWARFHRLR
jgi:hypothetical protein